MAVDSAHYGPPFLASSPEWRQWKGIYPDYRALTASTPLWQKGDGNCCPTAGRADVTLGLEAERLVIRDLKIVKGADAIR